MKIISKNSSLVFYQPNVFKIAPTEQMVAENVARDLMDAYPFLLSRKSFYILSTLQYGNGVVDGVTLTKKAAEDWQAESAERNHFLFYTRIHNELFNNEEKR